MMSAPPQPSETKPPNCPVCKKKPMNEHSFEEQQECVQKAKEQNIPL